MKPHPFHKLPSGYRVGSFAAVLLLLAIGAGAAPRSSEHYMSPIESPSAGGGKQTSVTYTSYNSIGEIGGIQGGEDSYARNGFIGQLTLPPSSAALSDDLVVEHQAAGTLVGELAAVDPELGEIYSFELIGGEGSDDNSAFSIAGNGLETADTFDYPAKSSYTIRVRVTDTWGLSLEKVFTIGVEPGSRPVVAPITLKRLPNLAAKIEISALLAAGSDPNGGFVSLADVAETSTAGGQIFLSGAWALYQPPAGYNEADSFIFTIADDRGVTATGTVTVVMRDHENAPLNRRGDIEIVERPEGHAVRIRFVGVPGRVYTIQATESLADPWETIDTRQADSSGIYEYIDEDAGDYGQRFYRAVRQ